MPVLLLTNGIRGVLEAAQRFDLVNYIKVPTSFSFYLIAAVGIPLHWKVSTIILVSVVARLASAGAFLFFCLRVFPQLRHGWHFSRHELPALFSFGGWVMVTNITGPLFGYLERFVIASVLSVGMLSYYVVPFELISKIFIFPASIAPVLFPYFSRNASAKPEAISDVSVRALKYLLLVMTPIVAVVSVFAHEILRLWVGSEFAARGTTVLQLLTIAFFLSAFAYVPFTSLQAVGRPDLKAIQDLLTLPFFLLYAWPLMAHFGIAGTGLAKFIATVIDCFLLFWFATRLKLISVRDCTSIEIVRSVLISALLFAVLYVIRLTGLPAVATLALILVSLCSYALLFWMLAIDANDKLTIKQFPKQFFPSQPEAAA